MLLHRLAREFYVVSAPTAPAVASWDASFDDGVTWLTGETPDTGITWRWLVAGIDADSTGADAVLTQITTYPILRATDSPEIVVRDAPPIVMIDVQAGVTAAPTYATTAQLALKVDKGAHVIDVRDYGALGDGVTDDTAAIQAALNLSASNGLKVILPTQNKVYVVTQITMPFRATIEIPAGVVLRRLATSVQTGPMILAQRNHDKIIGGGLIECLNACSSGIVRVERTDGTCEWGRFENVQLKGPGKTVTGSTGLVFSGTSTFQNVATGLIVSDVDTGIRFEGGANMNHLTHPTLYNIGTKAFDLVGSIECTIIGGSVSSSADITVFTLSGAATYNRFIGFAAEPGGSATMFSIGASALNNQFIGVVDNIAALGTDSGTRTLKLFTSRLTFPAPTTTNSSLELPHGTAPTSPINGAVWTTTAGMFVRINGVTKSVNLT